MPELKPGDQAPDFEATDDQGQTVRLSEFRGQKVVLYFYPRDDTPGCTTQACGFRDRYPEITSKKAVVLGVSTDSASSHQKFKAKFDLPFPLLVDAEHKIAEAYGVWGERKFAGRNFMGIGRSHFVIDEAGKIMEARYNVKPEESVESAVKAL